MSLWTPGGEHPVDRSRPEPPPEQAPPADEGPRLEDLTPEEREQYETMIAEMDQVRAQLLDAPAADVIANYTMQLYELAAIHLTAEQPKMTEARLAIDAMSAIVDGLAGRLGAGEATLRDARHQLQVAFVQRSEQP
jgi:hypothetical protein